MAQERENLTSPFAASPEQAGAAEKPKGWRAKISRVVHGKPLDTLEWGTSVLNVPPGMHRLKSALGLSAGLFIGAELMKVLTGNSLKGEAVSVESIHPLLQRLHGKLAYNFFSDAPADRWMHALHNLVPGVLGAIGTYQGSKNFFQERKEQTMHPEHLDEFESKASMLQAKPWGKMAGFSSMFSSVSGFSWLPIPNYGATLGTRFVLASGRKVALPGFGKFWSNNHSIYPMASPELIDHMIKYLAGNPSKDPKQLEAMAQGILGNWFKDVTEEQIQAFVQEIHEVRDDFLREGGIPEDMHKEFKKEMQEHFKGSGLEDTLEKIGLNPLEAEIGNNGVAGKVAEKTGAGKKLDELRASYVEKYQARKAAQQDASPSGHVR